ncbi:TenA family transcriptional regulator [Pseudomonas neustonica]|uniref:Biliverdin-producing heme oxygenase n=1 Tax=Pseudomonas neustonica TaxID=2487346 RepID=A0ABX9XGX3_9PSED|nr:MULTISPECIES: iron-containing redox enzyme family protein [Pseudomonas]MBA6420867.1 iron-containing redox enzyme family protein [Pseudomonas sp. 5Ae-yellow]ROZ80675.1 biliverdin-producing heme oxygenase [Pseudomonas sp. SSM44]ROZ81901.1 biliverdin-producing heme oxygenase [Pseudomonas neustonica]|tara:strand:+ start:2280 stop:2963 length:684 start_codon:yes stop_codon:yes gene_type:complete
MNFFDTLQEQTQTEREYLFASPMIQAALRGEAQKHSYVAFLSEAFHHVRHTVPLLMACGSRLDADHEWLREAMAEYIEEEIGHQEWILNDIRACGGDPEAVRHGKPGLATELMVSTMYDRINRLNPIAMLGMVFVLEGTSIALATQAAGSLKQGLGLPPQAFSYLSSHGSLDLEHMKFFETLVNRIDNDTDRDAVLHTAKVIYRLYAEMFRSLPGNIEQEVPHAAFG